jgi:hypothetical protein
MFLGSSVFVLAGAANIEKDPILAYVTISFFGLAVVLSGVSLLPSSSYLSLTSDGFTYSKLFQKQFVPWSQVAAFRAVKMGPTQVVGWVYSKNHKADRALRKVSAAAAGVENVFPETYAMPAADLVELLERVRTTHGTTAL